MSIPLTNAVGFGPYRLSARIATGGMAEVYAARRVEPDGRVGPMVALKRLLPHLAHDAAIVRMFLNEARITAQIHHPNVVGIHELGQHAGEPYIAMELLAGHSFGDLRQRAAHHAERVPLGITLKVLADACRGLDAAHRAVDDHGQPLCIVHRDFTPENIHVGVDGTVKVIDFGIAKAENLGSGTEPGTLKGKFFYMSPEMIAGRPVDHRADLYAAGVMLYEQLCGRRPFTGTTPDEVLERIAEARPRRPADFDPSVPPALEAICLMALKQDPNDRFQSLEQFIAALEQVGGSAGVASDEALAAYVTRLFPPHSDPKMAAIAEARAAFPSSPRPPLPLALPAAGQPKAQPAAPSAAAGAAARRSKTAALSVLVLLVIAAAAAGGYLARERLLPRLPPAERLAQAAKTADTAARVDALDGVHSDERASAAQLQRAGELLLEVGADEKALELAEIFAGRFPESADARLLEAQACIRLRLGKRAEAAIGEARRLDPKSAEPELALAELRELQGDASGAAAALAAALEKAPGSTKVAARQGYLLSQSGRLEEAAAVLSTVLKARFEPEAAAELGFVRYRQERLSEASALLKRAVKERPKLARAHYYLGAVLYGLGDRSGAERSHQKAEELAPDDPRPLVALCQIYQHGKRTEPQAAVRERMRQRFGERAAALEAQCGVR